MPNRPAHPTDLHQLLNGKTVEAMGRHRDWGDLPRFAALDVEQNGLEFARDLVAQTHDRLGRDAADRLVHGMVAHLPDPLRGEFLGGPLPKPRPLGVAVTQLPDDDKLPLFRPVQLAVFPPVPQPDPPKPPISTGGEDPDPTPPQPQPRPQPAPMPPPPRPTPDPEPNPKPEPKPAPDDEGEPEVGAEPPKDDGRCQHLSIALENARLHYRSASDQWQKAAQNSNRLSDLYRAKLAERDAAIESATKGVGKKCLKGAIKGSQGPGTRPQKITRAIWECIKANIDPKNAYESEQIGELVYQADEIEQQLSEAIRLTEQAKASMDDAATQLKAAQSDLSQAGCDTR